MNSAKKKEKIKSEAAKEPRVETPTRTKHRPGVRVEDKTAAAGEITNSKMETPWTKARSRVSVEDKAAAAGKVSNCNMEASRTKARPEANVGNKAAAAEKVSSSKVESPRHKGRPEVKVKEAAGAAAVDDVSNGDDGQPEETRNLSKVPGEIRTRSGFLLRTVSGDLFSCPTSVSLCHCVSRDFRLGKGIAKLFREKFGRIQELEASGAQVGGLAVLKEGNRFIYNLVTKEKYSGKPTYATLQQSLEAMRAHAMAHGVAEVAMPRIGCGLDQLQWPTVRTLLKNIFQHSPITITVYVVESKGSSNNGSSSQQSGAGVKHTAPGIDAKKNQSTAGTNVGFGYWVRKPLPDVFVGLRIFLPRNVANYDVLRRHVIGYGGVCLDRLNSSETAGAAPTHIIHETGSSRIPPGGAQGVRHVTLYWLLDSIKLRARQQEKFYPVKRD